MLHETSRSRALLLRSTLFRSSPGVDKLRYAPGCHQSNKRGTAERAPLDNSHNRHAPLPLSALAAMPLGVEQDGNSQDPSRVGGPTNPLLRDGGLSTVIGKGDSNGSAATQLARLQHRGSNPDSIEPTFGEGRMNAVCVSVPPAQYMKCMPLRVLRARTSRNLISAFGAIGEMADRLGLVPTIKDRANENYRDIGAPWPLQKTDSSYQTSS
eukprot:221163-Prorocentrum_minimum.AAC.1